MESMNSINAPEFSRNYGFWNEDEQHAILAARVAIAGVGGDGYQLGLKLARMGVQTFDVADPEVFEPENANRVPGATVETYGKSKAEAFADDVRKINPEADVRTFTDGLTEENVEDFLSRATLAFDETELTHLELGTMLSDEAIKRGIPDVMVMNVGFAGQVTSFHPNGKYSFRNLMGIPKGMPLDEVKEQKLDLSRCLPYLPPYVDLKTLETVQNDPDAPLPSIAQGVDVAAGLGGSQALLHMTRGVSKNRPEPIWAPHMGYMDAYNLKSGVTKHPRLSYYRHLGVMVARNALHLNPKANFAAEDRDRRTAVYEIEQAELA